jgi:predicted ATPase
VKGIVVGRQQELQQLSQWLEQVRAGQRQLVLISGEAAIGKTTLVNTFLGHYLGDRELYIGRGNVSNKW